MTATTLSPQAPQWHRLLPGLILLAAVLVLFRDTAQAMVAIWSRSETYTHAYLVAPISLWLTWRRREHLAAVTLRPAPWVLLPMAAVCALWLLGELAAAQALTQFALVSLVILVVPAAYGWQVTKMLLFPLLFLYFSVPVGDFLVPPMMEMTADFAVAAITLSGIPVYREGLQFIIPSGSWSVVDACSGVRYLIASFMVGTLFAYLNYQTTRRRVIFIGLSLLVPILANWLRAYMIVMLAHLSDNKIAAGVDHLIYGWVFFGIVIGLMFFIGARWSEPDAVHLKATTTNASSGAVADPSRRQSIWAVVGMAFVLLGLTQAASWKLNQMDAAPPALELMNQAGDGWMASADQLTKWTPVFKNPAAVWARVYRKDGDSVGVWVGYYRNQGYGNKLIASTNVLVEPVMESQWALAQRGMREFGTPAGPLQVRASDVLARIGAGGSSAELLRVWQVYWVGGKFIVSENRARLQIALNRLLGRGDDAAVLVFYTDGRAEGNPDARLERFAGAALAQLTAQLETTRARR